ncbi:DUF6597 domain-containing transcriptional factor [Aquabacterium sp.]|uniref:DUF6597 domain-containing transcriptional factor n=1 Tax=Aquabacterium sp. TaxID=1872578 RepID=UPI002CBF9766|nr:DUF6597 domain-containing transcriptional factor [Aquabacterium sp.]HSW09035.1 DUF6597 domain-containing transcriptional factor [Aquabacterium sp.]
MASAPSTWLSRRPAPPLGCFVDTLWTSERLAALPHSREWNLPTGSADLIVPLTQDALRRFDSATDRHGRQLAGGLLQGAQQGPTLRDTSTPLCVVGAHFRPGGLAGFFAPPADEFTDRSLPLEALWPGFTDQLRERLIGPAGLASPALRLQVLESALCARLRLQAPADAMVQWALSQLAGGHVAIGSLQRASECSPARFIARYRAVCGLSPKRHAALMRFNAVLDHSPQPHGWAAAAADAGYADQAHLVREFRRFAGFTPGEYLRNATAFASHVACR